MDISKVVAAVKSVRDGIALAKTELNNAISPEFAVMADKKAPLAQKLAASDAIQVAGRIDSALGSPRLEKILTRIDSSLKGKQPKEKKAKKTDAKK